MPQNTDPRERPVARRGLRLSTEGGTDQADKGQTDINRIVALATETGQQPHFQRGQPFYADLSRSVDFHTQHNRVIAAQARFMDLPASVRKVADNDPGKLLDLLETDEGTASLVDAGLLIGEVPLPPQPAPAAPPETPDPAPEEPV